MGKNKKQKANISKTPVSKAPVTPVAPEVKPEAKKPVDKPAEKPAATPVVDKGTGKKPKPVADPPKITKENIIDVQKRQGAEGLIQGVNGIPLSEINTLTSNILTRYSTHPVEGMNEELKDFYVGKTGFVDVLIAVSVAIVLQNDQTAIIKNLPKNYINSMLETLETIGVTVKDQKLIEDNFNEKDNSITIQPTGVEIEEGLATQIVADKKDEEEADAVEIKDNDEASLKARLIKIMVKNRDEKKPLSGVADAIEEMQLQDTLGADATQKEVIRNRTMTDKLNRLFSIIPFNTLLIATGRILVKELEKDKNPISVFLMLKKSLETVDSKKTVVYPFNDEEIATIIRIFVAKAIDLFDSTTNAKIELIKKKENLSDIEKTNLERLETSVAKNREISCILSNFSKEEIGKIGNYQSSIKGEKTLKTDEEKAANSELIFNTQLYFSIAKELKLDAKGTEDENLAKIHNYGVYVTNLFRESDEKLIPTGKIAITANVTEINPKEDGKEGATKVEPELPFEGDKKDESKK